MGGGSDPPGRLGRVRGRPADAPVVELFRPTPYAACCGAQVSWVPRRPTSPAARGAGRPRRGAPTRSPSPRAWSLGRRPNVTALARAVLAALGTGARSVRRRRPRRRRRRWVAGCTPWCATGAISHHYDLSNEFYELVLDPSMAYSCGWFEDSTLEQAQSAKLDLVCTKTRPRARMRMLDLGAGGVAVAARGRALRRRVVRVTISAQRRRSSTSASPTGAWPTGSTVRLQDYREVPDRGLRRRGSLEMERARGRAQLPDVRLGPAPRRPSGRPGARAADVAHGRAPGRRAVHRVVHRTRHAHAAAGRHGGALERGGLEVRGVQAARALRGRSRAGSENFEANVDRLTELVGEEVVRCGASPRRRLDGLPRRPDGRRPDPHGTDPVSGSRG